jgi:D-3-phosphoglycerate dehydrogenase
MATNKRKVLLPHTMGKQGIDLMQSRDDIETVIYPAGIAQADFLPLLSDCVGIALSGTTLLRPCRSWRGSAWGTTRWMFRR